MKMLPVDFTDDGQQESEATEFGNQTRTDSGIAERYRAPVGPTSRRSSTSSSRSQAFTGNTRFVLYARKRPRRRRTRRGHDCTNGP